MIGHPGGRTIRPALRGPLLDRQRDANLLNGFIQVARECFLLTGGNGAAHFFHSLLGFVQFLIGNRLRFMAFAVPSNIQNPKISQAFSIDRIASTR